MPQILKFPGDNLCDHRIGGKGVFKDVRVRCVGPWVVEIAIVKRSFPADPPTSEQIFLVAGQAFFPADDFFDERVDQSLRAGAEHRAHEIGGRGDGIFRAPIAPVEFGRVIGLFARRLLPIKPLHIIQIRRAVTGQGCIVPVHQVERDATLDINLDQNRHRKRLGEGEVVAQAQAQRRLIPAPFPERRGELIG